MQNIENIRETTRKNMAWVTCERRPTKSERKVQSQNPHAEHSGQLTPHFFLSLCQGGRSPINPSPAHRFLRTGGCEHTSKVPTTKAVIVQWGTQACFLGVCQHHRPNGIAHMPQAIGHAESKTVNRVGVQLKPLVELNPVLHPAVVKALWGLIEDQLEHGPAGSDLEEP